MPQEKGFMKKEKAQEEIQKQIQEDETLIGFFYAVKGGEFWKFFLFGPIIAFTFKYYYIAVTKKGIYFFRLSMFGKFKGKDFFSFDEFLGVIFKKGVIQQPVVFQLQNGKKIAVKAQLKGAKSVPKLDEEVREHIISNIR